MNERGYYITVSVRYIRINFVFKPSSFVTFENEVLGCVQTPEVFHNKGFLA